ncbi:MAG: asparagine synthase (glutamine-hydrolyzing), partial [Psychroserpens sp.]|nr:asparagine synthase (glutamine-hydrolyzing) [Psychroserpens sp.]
MCGINGIVYKSVQSTERVNQKLLEMNDLIIHRGPDDQGDYANHTQNYSIGMGMRRLSIIDLSTGHQPMYSDDQNICIVFNGEIYNYRSLKTDLQSKGISFKTTSDTEVILKLYETYGAECFKMLDGMFGISIHDQKNNKLFIARDYFGEKPLYYVNTGDRFVWASELKSVISAISYRPQINKKGLNLYFRLTYIPAPFTIYEDVHKLEPNRYVIYDLDTFDFNVHQIHNDVKPQKTDLSFDQAKKEVKDRVFKSVESRSVSDVPLGTFLSGGVDSSVVSYCLAELSNAKIDTFSIGFEKAAYDETDKSRVVADMIKSNHHEFIIKESDLSENINDILLNFDEPFADSSSLPTYLVSNKTKSFVKVALTGDGGDEVFGGYNKYYIGKLNSRYTKYVPKFAHNTVKSILSGSLKRKDDSRGFKYKLNKLINAIDYDDSYYWDIISLGFNVDDINSFLNSDYRESDLFEYYKTISGISNPKSLNDFRTIDRHLSLEGDMLVKVDRTSMLNSLECRAPFLNRDLFNFTSSLPEDYLLKKWSKKHILKEAFKSEFPEGFLEKSKQGFGVPVGDWLRDGLKNELLSYIDDALLEQQGIFDMKNIKILVMNHLNGKED